MDERRPRISPIYTGKYTGKESQIAACNYWLEPRRLQIASPNRMMYPPTLWQKIQEEREKLKKLTRG